MIMIAHIKTLEMVKLLTSWSNYRHRTSFSQHQKRLYNSLKLNHTCRMGKSNRIAVKKWINKKVSKTSLQSKSYPYSSLSRSPYLKARRNQNPFRMKSKRIPFGSFKDQPSPRMTPPQSLKVYRSKWIRWTPTFQPTKSQKRHLTLW